MIGAPWYLLAAGVALVILGHLVEGFAGPERTTRRAIDPKMRDKDIIKAMNQRDPISKGSAIGLLGYLLVGISILWRISRYFT